MLKRSLAWWFLILTQSALTILGLYLCINGIIHDSETLGATGGLLIGVGLIGIVITIEYRHDKPSSPTIIIIEQENPINISQKEHIRQVDITGMDPCAV